VVIGVLITIYNKLQGACFSDTSITDIDHEAFEVRPIGRLHTSNETTGYAVGYIDVEKSESKINIPCTSLKCIG
jgi:hypothetical protein